MSEFDKSRSPGLISSQLIAPPASIQGEEAAIEQHSQTALTLSFPFWVVIPKPTTSACEGPPVEATMPLTFSHVEQMTEFLASKKRGDWEVSLINRYSFEDLLTNLEAQSHSAVCHDLKQGEAGTVIPLTHLRESNLIQRHVGRNATSKGND